MRPRPSGLASQHEYRDHSSATDDGLGCGLADYD